MNCQVLAIAAALSILTAPSGELSHAPPTPVIYTTDLFHPHDDPDDHFDLAAVFAMPEVDLKGIVLEQGDKQLTRPGAIPVSQMNSISGRNVPTVLGLSEKLESPTDKALDQKPEFQQAVEFILETLRNSPSPVMITTVGSVRDVVAAYNRDPALFRRKVGKLLVFIGEASHPSFLEYNVRLDLQAYVGLMRSGLPIYWVPCFDGGLWKNGGHASFWTATHENLLRKASPALMQFFVYALEKDSSDPLAYLSSPVDPQRRARLLSQRRNLWCTAIFGVLSGRADPNNDLFGFSEVDVSISDGGIVRYGKSHVSQKVMRFEVRDKARYAEGMTAITADLLSRLGRRR